jgi:phage shock protein PspC (stress-responsive transcriptional regulator)
MDKRIKTRWEKRMLRWQIVLAILIPLLFGVVFYFVAQLIR